MILVSMILGDLLGTKQGSRSDSDFWGYILRHFAASTFIFITLTQDHHMMKPILLQSAGWASRNGLELEETFFAM